MLPDAEYFKPGNDISWLVKQFEAIYYNGSNKVADKFLPHEDASIVFNFSKLPKMLTPVDQYLPPFFLAHLSSKANLIMLEGETDVFIAT